MIHNMNAKLSSIIEVMNQSTHDFYLTGSRFWNNHKNENADWDFFVNDSYEVRFFLKNLNFEFISNSSTYSDGQCNGLMEFYNEKPVPEKNDIIEEKIHIQLVINSSVKKEVQLILFENFPNGFVDKVTARLMWKLGLECYNKGMKY